METANEESGTDRPDIRIDTEVFTLLSSEETATTASSPTIVRWLDCWRR
jgi:hypothetical protein